MIKKQFVGLGLCLLLVFLSNPSMAGPKYVSVKGCESCHKDEVADWEKSSHAKAFELLQAGVKKGAKQRAGLDPEKDYTADPDCLACHTTGYKEDGGFADAGSIEKFGGVGCEGCHGPGSEYRKLHKEKKTDFTKDEAKATGQSYGSIDATVCAKCHSDKSPFKASVHEKYVFNLEDRLKKNASFHTFYPLKGSH